MQIVIDAPHFCAGYDMESGRIAPIISYMKGWDIDKIKDHCKQKNWKLTIIEDEPPISHDYGCYEV